MGKIKLIYLSQINLHQCQNIRILVNQYIDGIFYEIIKTILHPTKIKIIIMLSQKEVKTIEDIIG